MIDLILSAGWPVWPLLALSVLALALILERAWFLRHRHVQADDWINPVMVQCQTALPTLQQSQDLAQSCLLGQLLAAGIERVRQHPLISDSALRQSLEIEGRVMASRLEKNLPILATIASAATLLGLLGTVIGMIEIFAAQSQQGHQPAQLAQGISIALYNTALGLVIAIPSLLAWRWLKSRADHHIMHMEVACERLVLQLQQLQRLRLR
ncbi:MAG: MotA/TolQ/ExbB proton channel family protein [Alphaproteobacteria bacterium]|nr:MotA/TolQ/ExbB proton channel family protein [Alphaproteobacteria bacterium]